jgi:malonate transporter and related proteins
MSAWLDAFVPVFGLLALGTLLRARLLQDDRIWAGIEKLIFWVLLPCLIISALASVNLSALPIGQMVGTIWGALWAGTGLSWLLARRLGHAHAAMTSVVQGGIRFNNLIGFALAGALWGAPGTAMAALATGIIVPMVQVITTLVFALGRGSAVHPLRLLRQIGLNPLLLGCAAGFLVSLAGGLPPGLAPTVRALGQATVALGLLCVGAALSFATLRDRPGTQAWTAAVKLLAVPAITLALARLLGLDGLAAATAVLLMALPTAATSYVMARAMGGDAPLMAAITTSEHALALVTLPVWVLLLEGLM